MPHFISADSQRKTPYNVTYFSSFQVSCDGMPHTPSQFSLGWSPPFLIWSNLWVAVASGISYFLVLFRDPIFLTIWKCSHRKLWKIKKISYVRFSTALILSGMYYSCCWCYFFGLSPGIPCTASSCGITSASALPNGPTCRFDMSCLVFDFAPFFWSKSQAGWSLFVWHFHCRSYFWYWFF